MNNLTREASLRIVEAFRHGKNCLEGSRVFSSGREILFRAAIDNLKELEITEGATVRWVKGKYGSGKTHFFARLIEEAHLNNWVTSFVEISGKGEGTELHRFEEIYMAVLRNMILPETTQIRKGESGKASGWATLLDSWFDRLRELAGVSEGGDVQSFRLRDMMERTVTELQRNWHIHGNFLYALRQFLVGKSDSDIEWTNAIVDWFYGINVFTVEQIRRRLRASGITATIKRRNAKEHLRHLSKFIHSRGYSGILILFDEVENVMRQTPKARRDGYTILRELIDNVDDQHGMSRTAFYLSGTPDLFESETGIVEYEALTSRVLLPTDHRSPNPLASVVDLSLYPLSEEDHFELAGRIARIYATAYRIEEENALPTGFDTLYQKLYGELHDLSPRVWVRRVVDELDRKRLSGNQTDFTP